MSARESERGDLRVIVHCGDAVDRVEVWTGVDWLKLRGVEPSELRFRIHGKGIVEAVVYGTLSGATVLKEEVGYE